MTTHISNNLEFAFAVKDHDGRASHFRVDCAENGYVRITTLDAHGNQQAFLVQWINGRWHRHKLSKDDGVEDICPVHPDGRHVHDVDAMSSKELLFSTDPRVAANVMPPRKCACGQVKFQGF